jgi:arylsulfatase A-like enzyme
LLDEVGIDAPEFHAQAQGRSFHPDADAEPRDRIVAEYMAPQSSMDVLEKRVGGLPAHVREYDRSLRAIRTDRYKYIRGSDGSRELYDLQRDPGEAENLADTRGDIVDDLDAILEKWLDSFEHADLSGDVEMRGGGTRARLEDLGYLQ